MSKVMKILRKCDDRISGGDVTIAIVPNSLYSKGLVRKCWDAVNLCGDTKPYESDDNQSDWLLARCYSESELREFLRNYGRE